ncbi:MAG: division/cell wall cluster transcriptional repressor MraZ [Armatimonadota bacterium]
MFRGGFNHSLDDKNRVIIPQKLRYELGEDFVITKGLNKCLWVFSTEEFRKLDATISAQPKLDVHALRLQRFLLAEAIDANTDIQGRVAIPSNLREHAEIEKEVMVIGAGNRIEIWSKQRWDEITGAITDEMVCESAKAIGLG